MPIYEYTCRSCDHPFEEWVRKAQDTPACPECGAANCERRISLPRIHSDGTRARSLKAAKKRDQAIGEARTRAQREYELSHDD